MWLHRNKQMLMAVMLVAVVSVLAKVVQTRSDFQPLRKHFHIYGCQSNKTVSRGLTMDVHNLETRPGFLLGLSGTKKTVVPIMSESSAPCRLRPDKFYCVRSSTTENQLTFVFHEIVFEESKLDQDFKKGCGLARTTEGGEKKQRKDNDEHPEQKMENQQNMTCNFRVDEHISLQSGYGFVSCQAGAGVGQWREWLTAVATAEAEAVSLRIKIIIGVICGTGGMLLLLVVCVVCRLRSARSTPYHLQRRPSNTSGRTYSTQDHPSRT